MELLKPSLGNYLSTFIMGNKQFSSLHTYCMFIGYQRSGHSLIGALLDAHPEMVIAHELNALEFLRKGYSRKQVFHLLLQQSKAFYQAGNEWMGYSYRVEGQWQGRYRELKVIGDKRGGTSSKILNENPELLDKIHSFCSNLRLLHVIRNPFDNITTMIKRREAKRNMIFSSKDLHRKIDHYFYKTTEIAKLKAENPTNILDIYVEEFIDNPESELARICKFLGVGIDQDYIRNSASIVFKQNRKSRHKVDLWTPENIELVQKRIDTFDFLERYSFDE